MIFLLCVMFDHCFDDYSHLHIILFPYFLNPIKNITVTCESFLIMAIALERLLAVSKPIRYRLGILRKSQRVHALAFILPPIVFSVIINVPKFFESEHVYSNITNEAGEMEVILDYDMTDLRLHPDYVYYYIHWVRFISTGIIPIIFLIIVNSAIYILLKSRYSKLHCRTISFKCREISDKSQSSFTETINLQPRTRNVSDRSLQSSDSIISRLSNSSSYRSRSSTSNSFTGSNDKNQTCSQQNFQPLLESDSKNIQFSKNNNSCKSIQSRQSSRNINTSYSVMSRLSQLSEDTSLESQPMIRRPSFRVRRRTISSNSAFTLIAIVILYVICNIPRLALNLAEHLLEEEINNNFDLCGCHQEPIWFLILIHVNHFLLTVNSSANFIIYLALEKQFKTTFKEILDSMAKKNQRRNLNSGEFNFG